MIRIDAATESDLPQILAFIRGLAEYEKLAHQCVASESALRKTLFGERRYADVLIARRDDLPVGFALFFHNYSTFLGRHGIFLEDLFVYPELRGKGVGKALLATLARRCVKEGLRRLEWVVLDWNEPSIGFYRSLGAIAKDEWTTYCLTGVALTAMGSSAE